MIELRRTSDKARDAAAMGFHLGRLLGEVEGRKP